MEVIKLDRVVSVSSEIQGHSAQNLLDGEIRPNKNWMCDKGTDKAAVILQLERAVVLTSIHIGNAHSAFVEVLVGRAADSSDQFESLIPMSTFMNPHESKTGKNPNQTRFFNKEDFSESTANKSWDRLKIVCSQPFNKHVPYGLCFFKVHGEKEGKNIGGMPVAGKSAEEDEIQIGSFFKKKRNSDGDRQLSVSEQMKEAEKESSLAKHTPLSISKLTAKMREKQSSEKKPKKPSEEDQTGKQDKKSKEEPKPKKRKLEERPRGDKKKEETKQKKEEPEEKKKKQKKPFKKLMEDVVLVISGFKNPLRGNIRSMALEMGARYTGDWEQHSTHLVCAFDNTPKFHQVKGKGKIVKKEWVERCHADKRRYPWRRFALDKTDSKKPESEEEIDAGDESPEPESEEDDDGPSTSAAATPKRSRAEKEEKEKKKDEDRTKSRDADEYDVPTDEDDKGTGDVDTSDYPMPYLPDMFSSKTFYLDPQLKNKSTLERYIIAYNGILMETFNNDVEFYITDRGGALVEVFRKKVPKLVAVKPSWIWEVNSKQEFIPITPHLVK